MYTYPMSSSRLMSSINGSLADVRKANTPVTKDWCHLKNIQNVFEYIWTIDNFHWLRQTNHEYIESSVFPSGASNDIPKWSVRAYPNFGEYLALSIVSHNDSKINASFKCAILNDEKKETNIVTSNRLLCNKGAFYNIDSFIYRSKLLNTPALLPQNTLTILCEVNVLRESVISGQSKIVEFKVPDSNLSEDFGAMLDNDQFSDVTLVAANGHELKAHKSILAARSKVFAAMFQHKMEEHISNRVNITDINHEVLTEMLRYIYTDKVPNLMTMAEELLTASDKYALENLKAMCKESLRENITINNAASTLRLADRHNAKQLKSEAMDFIIHNASSVVESQGWKDMTKTHAYLVVEAFTLIASKQLQHINV